MNIQESYNPVLAAASMQVSSTACLMGGFLCSTSGNIQLRKTNVSGAIVVASMPVVAGVFHSIPFSFGDGVYAELTGGATGTFGIL
jgi:hypothetical protein